MTSNDNLNPQGDSTGSPSREELRERCRALLSLPKILDAVDGAITSQGFVGPIENVLLVYLATTTRLFPSRVVSVILTGPPSSGKSETIKSAIGLHPPEAYLELTSMSNKALLYTPESFEHRMLVVYETDGLSQEFMSYGLRSLLSEGCLKYEVTVIEQQTTRHIEKPGPTGLLSSTAGGIERQLLTRVLTPTVDDGEKQTRAIMLASAREAPKSVDLDPFHSLQRYIATGPTAVWLPFGVQLAEMADARAVRMRRDFPAVLRLTEAHALLHQESRDQRPNGAIVASLDDYAAVHSLIATSVAEAVERTVPPEVRETVEVVGNLNRSNRIGGQGDGATVRAIADKLGVSRTQAQRRAARAQSLGYLQDLGGRRQHRYVPGDPMPEDRGVLPSPDDLRKANFHRS